MTCSKHLGALLLLPLASLIACGDDSSAEPKDDMGYVILDGGGPRSPTDFTPPPPLFDTGQPASGEKGKFCNGVFINGKKISLAVRIGSVMLSASSGSCSKCLGLAAGTNSMTIYSGGSKVGGGTAKIEAGKEYVFWMTYDQATKKAKIQGKSLDPTKGEGCDKFTPKM